MVAVAAEDDELVSEGAVVSDDEGDASLPYGRLGEHEGVRAVAAWDPDASRVAGTGLRLAASAEELVRMPGVDCVFIASPPAVHLAQANLAFDAGKAVFCEKPLSTNASEARATIARIEREGRRAAVNFSPSLPVMRPATSAAAAWPAR